jgi:Tfp pilus assembly protein PilE
MLGYQVDWSAFLECTVGACLFGIGCRIRPIFLRAGRAMALLKTGGRQAREQRPNRAGVSQIELVAVLAIVGLLLSILAPAVQAALERARRTSCLNRLRQVALACDAHHALHGKYPPGPVAHIDAASRQHITRNASVFVALLPFLDQEELARRFNADETGKGAADDPATSEHNAELLRVGVPGLQCPSDRPWGSSCNYRACLGTGPALHETAPADAKSARRGAFGATGGTRAASVRDGLSHTVFFSERVVGDSDPSRYTAFTDIHFRAPSMGGFLLPDDAARDCRLVAGTLPRHVSYAGSTWLLSGFNNTWYNHVLAPNSRTPDCASNDAGALVSDGAVTARSWHAGGVHAALGDGSARFFSESIDLDLWRALASIQGNEQAAQQ